MTDSWHIDTALLSDYEEGTLSPSRVMAVEAHMLACAGCRTRVPVDYTWLTGNFSVIYDNVHAPRVGPLQRLLTRLGLPEHRLRLLTATPALRWSWLAATAAVLGLAVAVSWLDWSGAAAMSTVFLALAPILPVATVATAYGPSADPMREITGTTPAAGPALVLWRAVAVVGVAVVMAAVAGLLLPGPGWFAAAWLLPALLLCTGTLALATSLSLPVAAGTLGGLWLTGLYAVVRVVRDDVFVPLVFGPPAQFGYLAAAAAAAAVLTLRRRRFDLGESR
ncbi:zf-HC2 domain-containing protein [Actinoplanes sp. NEAU-A12]|uniref:Zf-HC2 domain-containing protein n=1 Tax=Actinoplanes sandaracinus TaxID=3045177 RepID=A0ABT6WTH3_9ACTN|nr:zf-HC2 domain-containing protein [Actinoplanes sandaracinus]MDI6099056.1 zf-HC2 domain-containing protein [Actinoplanes sandaracinus]MDI6102951.1 zf-HC2 domain-containing protein [Actinoplanes sandaracinus]